MGTAHEDNQPLEWERRSPSENQVLVERMPRSFTDFRKRILHGPFSISIFIRGRQRAGVRDDCVLRAWGCVLLGTNPVGFVDILQLHTRIKDLRDVGRVNFSPWQWVFVVAFWG